MPATTELLEAAVAALGGTKRENQVRMAQAVTEAMQRERHLAVQAGTGTGKSLAYLVPAIRHAQATDTTVVVSTATIALQRQLVGRDLPRLADALEPLLERRPTFAIMKGRSNYLCQNKIGVEEPDDALLDEDSLTWVGRHVARLHEWANDTETGDRDDLEPGVPDLAWRAVSVSARECVGASRCPHGDTCFAEAARKQAQDADVIVTNHALLAIDALSDAQILPEHDVVIVDEAHELDGRITAVATNEIGATTLSLSANRAQKLGAEERAKELKEVAQEWEQELLAVEAGRITALAQTLQSQLEAVRNALWRLKDAIAKSPEGEQTNAPERFAERLALNNHLLDQHDSVVRILEVFEEPDPAKHEDVVWVLHDERRGTHIKVAPLSVAGLLHTRLFGENTCVLTSATLAIGGNFQAMAAAWGLPRGSFEAIDVGSPFDPATKGILYTPTHLPEPGRDGLDESWLDHIATLILAAGGRTLGLFSSKRAAVQAAEAMRKRLPFEIYCQGDDSTSTLIQAFAKNHNACLFGTLTLWQGVDVPGPSCSLVIIDRIPFPRPDDPLLQARKIAADADGRNGFMEVAATHAALLMAQGAGRLLRSVEDRGVVAILDKRIVEKRYGSFLLSSLPQFWRTSDAATVEAALKRLVASS
ncbi:ATP-dependent DNA helicase [Corynebacterium pelargi]|uniref:ATP-dependent DNA helicase n=1 Tax=Corynebacterium pelargi TaxID=1471400 RepID=UPI0019AA659C|nr:Rad3-related DNA helicase [Corynebacterium pelargi]